MPDIKEDRESHSVDSSTVKKDAIKTVLCLYFKSGHEKIKVGILQNPM